MGIHPFLDNLAFVAGRSVDVCIVSFLPANDLMSVTTVCAPRRYHVLTNEYFVQSIHLAILLRARRREPFKQAFAITDLSSALFLSGRKPTTDP